MAARAPKALVAGNWKMNGLKDSEKELKALMRRVKAKPGKCDVMICPPATLIGRFATVAAKSDVSIGGQDAHMNVSGAHTGDVSAQMLADAGANAVIVGHSERRADHGETDQMVKAKAQAVHAQKLTAIICVGETEAERDAGKALGVVGKQVRGSIPADATAKNTVIAYEPVWAIGTGRTPTAKDVEKVHGHIRKALVKKFGADGEKMRILYGGSVKAANAVELMGVPNVNGALVGGASLKAADFDGIIDAYRS